MKWMDGQMVQKVAQPVFMVHGRDDKLLKLDSAQKLQGQFSNLKSVRILDNCSHMPMMEKPDETCAAILHAVGETWA